MGQNHYQRRRKRSRKLYASRFPGIPTILEESAHIGHGAIIHSAHIGKNCLVGMNAVVMDNAKIGDECIIGALSFVPTGFISENRKLIVGSPAKIIREVSDEMIAWKTKGTAIYQELLVKVKPPFNRSNHTQNL